MQSVYDYVQGEPVKALSWKQPYGSLMLPPFLKIETRTWNTAYRGWVLIACSQKSYSQEQIVRISGYDHAGRINNILQPQQYNHFNGQAIGIGKLIECRLMTEQDSHMAFVAHWQNSNLYVHVYDLVRSLNPTPWKGGLGFRDVPVTLQKLITLK